MRMPSDISTALQADSLHGVPGLTKDREGYVYWHGQYVDHFSYPRDDPQREMQAAQGLAQRCARLEAAGLPVNASTALFAAEFLKMAATLPNGKDWALAWVQTKSYVYAEHPLGAAVLHFWTGASRDESVLSSWHLPAAAGKPGKPLLVLGDFADPDKDVGLTRCYACESDGYVSKGFLDDTQQMVHSLNARGVTPQDYLAAVEQARQAHEEHLAEQAQQAQQRAALVPRCAT